MQKMMNRLWDWAFHPSVQPLKTILGKASTLHRYPVKSVQQPDVVDYKTPFEYSKYNIRYLQNRVDSKDGEMPQVSTKFEQSIQQLNNFGLNTQQTEQILQDKVQKIEQNEFLNEFKIEPINHSRKDAAILVKRQMQRNQIQFPKNNMSFKKEVNQSPQIYPIESLDLYYGPQFQKQRLELEDMFEKMVKQQFASDQLVIQKGQRRFWKALDSSNTASNIEKVQLKILNDDDDALEFQLRNNRIRLQKNAEGDIQYLHPETK